MEMTASEAREGDAMTTKDLAEMVRMWSEGRSGKFIADSLGMSTQAVYSYVSINRDKFPHRHHFATDAEVDAMAALWADGKTAKAIATKMGMTVSSVKGYIETHRDMFPRRRIRK